MIYLIKFNILLIAGYLLYKAFFQNGTTVQARRIFLLFVLLFAGVIPFLSPITIATNTSGLQQVLAAVEINGAITTEVTNTTTNNVFSLMYLIAVGGMALFTCYRIFSILTLIAGSQKRKSEGYIIISNEKITTPASFFNFIFMPAHLDGKAYALIYQHERLHARQWHSADVLLFEVVKWFSWFNPFVYLLQKEIRFVHECIADKEAGEANSSFYQELLVQFHLTAEAYQLTNHFNQTSNLKRRITMFNSTSSVSANIKKMLFVLPFFIIIGMFQVGAQTTAQSKNAPAENVVNPEFPGGMEAMMQFLSSNIVYPEAAKTANIQGTSFVSFTVSKSGKIKNVQIKKGADAALDAEAIRVIKSMPNWNPGTKEGKKVEAEMVLPIRFALN